MVSSKKKNFFLIIPSTRSYTLEVVDEANVREMTNQLFTNMNDAAHAYA